MVYYYPYFNNTDCSTHVLKAMDEKFNEEYSKNMDEKTKIRKMKDKKEYNRTSGPSESIFQNPNPWLLEREVHGVWNDRHRNAQKTERIHLLQLVKLFMNKIVAFSLGSISVEITSAHLYISRGMQRGKPTGLCEGIFIVV